jgi:hypothetical protein
LEELLDQAAADRDKVIQVTEFLFEQGRIQRKKDLRLRWKG